MSTTHPPSSARKAPAAGLTASLAAVGVLAFLPACRAEKPKPSPAPAAPAAAATPAAPAAPAAPALVAAPAPGTLVPQPDGPVPEGKVWSPEHGHWHDAAPAGGPGQPIQIQPMAAGDGAPVALTPAGTPGTLVPQPDGPVPEGKVWSPEHGHWHDAAPAGGAGQPIEIQPMTPGATPGTLVPQPDGPVPPGKVWSPEHGHWHDAAPAGGAAQPIQIQPMPMPAGGAPAPGTLVPQPDGPVPPGKVWSPEHGHWHDAAPVPVQVTPAPAPAPAAPKPAEPKKP